MRPSFVATATVCRTLARWCFELSLQSRNAPDATNDDPVKEKAAMNKLKQLEACGQSPWLDYLKRSLIEKGECARSSSAMD